MKSARARREIYVGPWLPEPLVEPLDAQEAIADDVTVTLMLALSDFRRQNERPSCSTKCSTWHDRGRGRASS